MKAGQSMKCAEGLAAGPCALAEGNGAAGGSARRSWPNRPRRLHAVPAVRTEDYEFLRDTRLVDELRWRGFTVETWETEPAALGATGPGDTRYFLESIPVDFESLTCEWPFGALRDAALRLIEMQLFCLARGAMLLDLRADSIQFRSGRPVHVDLLAFGRRTEEGAARFLERFRALYLEPLGVAADAAPGRDMQALLESLAARISARAVPVPTGADGPVEGVRGAFVEDFVRRTRPRLLFDLHGGSGAYGALALVSGARSIVGLEPDAMAAETYYERAHRDGLRALPLRLDRLEPGRTASGDPGAAVLALEAGARGQRRDVGSPDEYVAALLALAPQGVIEISPERPDSNATDAFRAAIGRCGRILREQPLDPAGADARGVLIAFERL